MTLVSLVSGKIGACTIGQCALCALPLFGDCCRGRSLSECRIDQQPQSHCERALIGKCTYPRALVPMATRTGQALAFGRSVILLRFNDPTMAALLRVQPCSSISYLHLTLLALSLGLLGAALNVKYRDYWSYAHAGCSVG